MQEYFWIAATLVMIGLGLGAFWLLPGPRPLSWWHRREARPPLWRRGIQWVWHRVTMERTREDAATMRSGATQLFLIIGIVAVGLGSVLLIAGVPAIILLVLVAAAVIFIPNILIRRRFARWQRRTIAGLPGFLHHLQILLDLGDPLVTAVKRARQRVDGPLGISLDRVIFQLERGLSVGDAFGAMARRTRRMETMVLATVLSTTAGRRLSGKSLEPLMVMLNSIKAQEQERISGSVDQIASVVPILAVVGAMIVGLYLMLGQALTGLGGISL